MSFQHNLATATPIIQPTIAPTTESEFNATDEFNAVIGMSLADAIREGAEFMPQTIGWGDGKNSGCALTVAALAIEKKGYR